MMRCLILLLVSITINAAENKNIGVFVSKPGVFDVLYHRAQSTATGAVFFGLIGAGVQEGVLKGKDIKKKKQVLQLLLDSSCKSRFINPLQEKLNKNKFNPYLIDSGKSEPNKWLLNIRIIKCGFKMVNTDTKDISAFIDFNVSLKEGKKIIYKSKFTVKGKHQHSFNDLITDKQKINDEFESVLQRAGIRLANKIIYL